MKTIRGLLHTMAMPCAAAWVIAFGFAFLTPIPAGAEKMTELEEVKVTAVEMEERLSAELAQYGSQAEVITREDIERTGNVDIAQAVEQLVPGLYGPQRFGRGSGDLAKITMQGSVNSDILYLIDGVRISSRLSAGRTPFDLIGIGMIDRIEVIKSGQSLFYGTNALNGVINIITKKVSKETSGSNQFFYGTLADRGVAVDASTTVDGHGVLLFGNTDATDGYDPWKFKNRDLNQINNRRRDREFERTNVGGKYRKEFGEGQILNFFVMGADIRNEFPRSFNRFISQNDRTDFLTWARWDDVRNENRQFSLRAYYNEWWSKWTAIDGYPTNAMFFDTNPSNMHQWGYEDWGVNLIADVKQNDGSEYIFGGDYQSFWGKDEVIFIPPTDHTISQAAFLQYRPYLASHPDLKMAMGGRFTHVTGGKSNTVWNTSIRQPLKNEQMYIRGIVGTAFRLPAIFQLKAKSATQTGNPNLGPEESFGLDVGVGGSTTYRNLPVRWDLGHFHQKIRDLIALDAANVWQNTTGRSRVKGFEFQLAVEPSPQWTFDGSVSFAEAKQSGDPRQMENRPTWFTKGALKYRPASGRLRDYVDGIDFMGQYIGNVYEYTAGLTDLNYGKYFVGDVAVNKAFGSRKEHKLTLRIENIANKDYTSTVSSVTASQLPAGVAAYHEEARGTPRNVILSYNRSF